MDDLEMQDDAVTTAHRLITAAWEQTEPQLLKTFHDTVSDLAFQDVTHATDLVQSLDQHIQSGIAEFVKHELLKTDSYNTRLYIQWHENDSEHWPSVSLPLLYGLFGSGLTRKFLMSLKAFAISGATFAQAWRFMVDQYRPAARNDNDSAPVGQAAETHRAAKNARRGRNRLSAEDRASWTLGMVDKARDAYRQSAPRSLRTPISAVTTASMEQASSALVNSLPVPKTRLPDFPSTIPAVENGMSPMSEQSTVYDDDRQGGKHTDEPPSEVLPIGNGHLDDGGRTPSEFEDPDEGESVPSGDEGEPMRHWDSDISLQNFHNEEQHGTDSGQRPIEEGRRCATPLQDTSINSVFQDDTPSRSLETSANTSKRRFSPGDSIHRCSPKRAKRSTNGDAEALEPQQDPENVIDLIGDADTTTSSVPGRSNIAVRQSTSEGVQAPAPGKEPQKINHLTADGDLAVRSSVLSDSLPSVTVRQSGRDTAGKDSTSVRPPAAKRSQSAANAANGSSLSLSDFCRTEQPQQPQLHEHNHQAVPDLGPQIDSRDGSHPNITYPDRFHPASCKVAAQRLLDQRSYIDDEGIHTTLMALNPDPARYSIVRSGFTDEDKVTKPPDMRRYKVLIFPVHLGNHWTAAFVHLQDRLVHVYDSFHQQQWRNTTHQRVVKFLQRHRSEVDTWSRVDDTTGLRQLDGVNCGVFVLIYLLFRMHQITPPRQLSPAWRPLFASLFAIDPLQSTMTLSGGSAGPAGVPSSSQTPPATSDSIGHQSQALEAAGSAIETEREQINAARTILSQSSSSNAGLTSAFLREETVYHDYASIVEEMDRKLSPHAIVDRNRELLQTQYRLLIQCYRDTHVPVLGPIDEALARMARVLVTQGERLRQHEETHRVLAERLTQAKQEYRDSLQRQKEEMERQRAEMEQRLQYINDEFIKLGGV